MIKKTPCENKGVKWDTIVVNKVNEHINGFVDK